MLDDWRRNYVTKIFLLCNDCTLSMATNRHHCRRGNLHFCERAWCLAFERLVSLIHRSLRQTAIEGMDGSWVLTYILSLPAISRVQFNSRYRYNKPLILTMIIPTFVL